MATEMKDGQKAEERAVEMIVAEYARAEGLHGPFHSLHEGYAALLEEVDELWDEIKKNNTRRDRRTLLEESVQVAAMGLKMAASVLKGIK